MRSHTKVRKKKTIQYLEKHHINNNIYLINIFVVTQTYFTTKKAKIKCLKKNIHYAVSKQNLILVF